MPLVLADRVRETTTTTGTGTISLAGPVSGFQGFSTAIGNANTTYYTIVDAATGAWEVGLGTYTSSGSTLARTTVLSSSNSDALVPFASGTKDVFVTQPAERAVYVLGAGTGLAAGAAAFTANGVPYASATNTLTTGSALTFDGTNLATTGTATGLRLVASSTDAGGSVLQVDTTATAYGRVGGSTTMGYVAGTQSLWTIGGSEQMRLTSTGLGIGTSSPSTKLQINASGANPAWLYSTNGTSGSYFGTSGGGEAIVYQTGAYPIQFYTNSTERMRLDASGNLGLGVTPSAWGAAFKALQFAGGSGVHSNTVAQDFNVINQAYNNGSGYVYQNSSQPAARYQQYQGTHQWYTAPSGTAGNAISFTQAMTLDASGKLMNGTTSSVGQFTVFNAGSNDGAENAVAIMRFGTTYGSALFHNYNTAFGQESLNLSVSNGAGTPANNTLTKYRMIADGTHVWYGATTATERMRLDSSGNLGIGTSSPAGKLSVNVDASTELITFRSSGGRQIWAHEPGGNARPLTIKAQTLTYADDTSTRLTIDGSGNLLVGTTTTGFTNSRSFTFQGVGDGKVYVNHSTANTNGDGYIGFGYNGTQIGSITQNGTTGVLYNINSDYRLKNITGPITTSGAYIDSLNPVEGTWKVDGSTFVGLIAHEVQEASRTNVATGTKDGEEMQGMDYSSAEIIANLIAELQSLRARVAQLEKGTQP